MSANFCDEPSQSARPTVIRSDGVTQSEQYLKKLCDKSFLSLWSYPGVFRDQGRKRGRGDGKEVADFLVVFENDVIIFSDKHIEFDDTDNIELAWQRWFRKAVLKSAQQVWGAERWLRQFPNSLFLDRQCATPFPIALPKVADMICHRVVVAHDASRVCQARLGGSGSLMLQSTVVGDEHLSRPFTIGRIDATKGFVHVFDDTSLDVVMTYLDTVSDFVSYLTKKEKLLTGRLRVSAAGEEELLSQYVGKLNGDGEHDFVFPRNVNTVVIGEGEWSKFLRSEAHTAQVKANEISYSWDLLVEKFLYHLMSGTQYETSDVAIGAHEQSLRWLARENRTRRRMLAKAIHGLLAKTPPDYRASRLLKPSQPGDPYYLFLLLPRYQAMNEKDYRRARSVLLREYCQVVKLDFPDAQHIIGIATETMDSIDYRSEDFVHLDATDWNEALNEQARKSKRELGIFIDVKTFAGREREYPVGQRRTKRATVSRNSSCPCGSGRRFKRCCGPEPKRKT